MGKSVEHFRRYAQVAEGANRHHSACRVLSSPPSYPSVNAAVPSKSSRWFARAHAGCPAACRRSGSLANWAGEGSSLNVLGRANGYKTARLPSRDVKLAAQEPYLKEAARLLNGCRQR